MEAKKLELGCGANKREGFFGIDITHQPGVDLVLDLTKDNFPFPDNSIEYIYSNHMFEHLGSHALIFREIFRVCRHDALVEIWTPYGKSNDGFLYGHTTFFTETHIKHLCFERDRFFLRDAYGYFFWEEVHYDLFPGIIETLRSMNIPLEFALEHMFNIAMQWGVFLRVKKDAAMALGPQIPKRTYCYGRGNNRQTEIIR